MVKSTLVKLGGTAAGMVFALAFATSAQAQSCDGPGCGGPIDGTPGTPTTPTPVDPGTPSNPGTTINIGPIQGGTGGSVTDSGNSRVDIDNSGNNVGGAGGSVDNSGNNVGGSATVTTGGTNLTWKDRMQFYGNTAAAGMPSGSCTTTTRGFGVWVANMSGNTRYNEELCNAQRQTVVCQTALSSPDDTVRASAVMDRRCGLTEGVDTIRGNLASGAANGNNGTMGLVFGVQAAPAPAPAQPVVVSVPAENVTYQQSGRVEQPAPAYRGGQ